MSIKSLMITCVESQYTQPYIANVFWRQDIAKVSSITLIPYIKNSEIYNVAYISIDEWCESESAYNFIQRLKNPNQEARIVHFEDSWWPVQMNTHNNGELNVGDYTVSFESDYWVKNEVSTVSCSDAEVENPIKGLNGEYYTVEEASQRLSELDVTLGLMDDERPSSSAYRELCNEINQLSNELCIHEALNKKSNVTERNRNRKYDDAEYLRMAEEYFSHPVCMIPDSDEANTFLSSLTVRSNA